MKLAISQEKGPIGRKFVHWASFLGTGNRLSNASKNPFPGGFGLCLSVKTRGREARKLNCSQCKRKTQHMLKVFLSL